MKKGLVLLLTAICANAFCENSESSYYTMVTDCKDFAVVNVLPTWKYYDSGVNAYMTLTPASELPLVRLDGETSSTFEQDYEVTISDEKIIVTMSRRGSVVTLFVETPKILEGSYKTTAVVGPLNENFKEKFGSFEDQVFSCESKIIQD